MPMASFDTPILLLIFNRPDTTEVVFRAIREVRPTVLFVAADGPRRDRPDDVEKCNLARNIIRGIDWPCQVHQLFQATNLGCGRGPAAGISWFFEHVTEGIILEDDIHPSPDFFLFCRTLLERYRNDARVMEIGGVNLIARACEADPYDYHFSDHGHTWGWATWRRAWRHFDYTIRNYRATDVQYFLRSAFGSAYAYTHFRNLLETTYCHNSRITWWDYQWEFARRINSGLSVVPAKNLIINIGLGKHATHTLDAGGPGTDLIWGRLSFPLKHPPLVAANRARDHYYFKTVFSTQRSRLRFNLTRLVPAFLRHTPLLTGLSSFSTQNKYG